MLLLQILLLFLTYMVQEIASDNDTMNLVINPLPIVSAGNIFNML